MAKGIPLMGRGPDGKAKIINVDENGNVKVQQSGTIVPRIVRVGMASGISSPANTTTEALKKRDTSLFVYLFAVIRTDLAHSWDLLFQHVSDAPLPSMGHATMGDNLILSSTKQRDQTEWWEVRGTLTTVRIRNNSDEDRIYDILLYGVR